MSDENKKKFADNYFEDEFPPNHNPAIGPQSADTLSNVRNGLCALDELARSPEFSNSKEVTEGYGILSACLVSALEFEIYNRE